MKTKLAQGRTVNGTFVAMTDPSVVEVLGYAGLDYVILDCEHGPNDIGTLGSLIRAAEISGTTAIVRVTKNDPALILRALDLGAGGVLVPQVNSAAEAESAARAARYAPQGQRGIAGIVRAARYGFTPMNNYIEESNRRVSVIVQVEDVKSVANLDEILAVDGVDGIFIGPTDLSQSMGCTGQFDKPEFCRVVEEVIDRAVKTDKFVGIFCVGIEDARRWRNRGARMLAVGADTALFAQAAKALAKDLATD